MKAFVSPFLPARVLFREIEVGAVRAEEDVAGQGVKDREAAFVVRRDVRDKPCCPRACSLRSRWGCRR